MTKDEAWLLEEKYQGEKSEGFFADCKRLALGEPLGYLIGWVPFLNTTIWLDSHPLIPRPETEYWTEKAIAEMKTQATPTLSGETPALQVLDLCAGSGCVGVAIAHAIPTAHVDFAEIEPNHLPTIQKNLTTNCIANRNTNCSTNLPPKSSSDLDHLTPPSSDLDDATPGEPSEPDQPAGLGEQYRILHTNLFIPARSELGGVEAGADMGVKADTGEGADIGESAGAGAGMGVGADVRAGTRSELVLGRYDYIFSNPPYIDASLGRVTASVKTFEPAVALYGGTHGLEIIATIIKEAGAHLTSQGQLWLEHEPEQSFAIGQLAAQHGFASTTHTDQYGVERYSILVVK